MRYIFVDTNLFIDAITSNDGDKILNSIFKQLSKKDIKFILPEVIKMEILTQYDYWKDDIMKSIKTNLETKKILGIKDVLTDAEKKNKKKQKGETEAEKIDSVIEPHRKEMVKKIEERYKLTSKRIDQIFKHRNTKIVALTDQILLAGMRRSLLKKAPYTRSEKATESAHTKDVDCIAFETLMAFCKKNIDEHKKDILILCVSDQDYYSSDGKLHTDLIKDIKTKNKSYQSISEMLDNEFKIKIGSRKLKKTKESESKTGSLADSRGALVENSKIITQ